MGSIYKIQFPNGKYYIGLTTTSLEQRRQEHKYCAKRGETQCLYNALRKYEMIDTFELIEIDTAETLEELCEMEIRYIDEYNSYYMNGKGYNMTFGGEGINGYIYTEEDKQNQSERLKKYYENNYEARQRMSDISKNYYENAEVRQRQSERMKKYYENSDTVKEHSKKLKKYYEEHPEVIKKRLDIQGKNKPFDIFTTDGTFIKTFTYQFEAKEYLQKEHNIITSKNIVISAVLAGKQRASAGFVFKYK